MTIQTPISLIADGLKIVGQFFQPDEDAPEYPAVCLCHGIPSGIVDPSDGGYPALAAQFSHTGFATQCFNFRGTGASQGNFDIVGWTRDAQAVIDYLWTQPRINISHIFLVGFSAGAAVAIYVSAHDARVSGVVACASPADFYTLSEEDPSLSLSHFRKIGIIRDSGFPPTAAGWREDFRRVNPSREVAGIAPRPLLIVHGRQDSVVPFAEGQKLFNLAGEPKQLAVIENAEHRLRKSQVAVDLVTGWLRKQSGLS